MKQCSVCGEVQEESNFYRDRSTKDGLKQPCKECNRDLRRGYKQEAKVREKLKRRGITKAEFNALLASQGFACAICRAHASTQKSALHIDHDHETGKTRGLLCSHCNFMLGHARDSSENLRAGAAYLDSFK